MSAQTDPMEEVYAELDAAIAAAVDQDEIGQELRSDWSWNPLVMKHLEFRLGPQSAVFDAHLEGIGVTEHRMSARYVAALLTGVTEASKEIAKHARGVKTASNDYLVRGVMPGSVRLVIEAPPGPPAPERPDKTRDAPLGLVHAPTHESNALRAVARILSETLPSQHGHDRLEDIISRLPGKARGPLLSVAHTVREGGIQIDGEVRERQTRTIPLEFTPDRADHLADVISRQPPVAQDKHAYGYIDGFRKKSRTVYIAPLHGRTIGLNVPDDRMLAEVAELSIVPEQHVRADYVELMINGIADGRRHDARVLQRLKAIEELEIEQPPLPIDEIRS